MLPPVIISCQIYNTIISVIIRKLVRIILILKLLYYKSLEVIIIMIVVIANLRDMKRK